MKDSLTILLTKQKLTIFYLFTSQKLKIIKNLTNPMANGRRKRIHINSEK